MTGWKHWYAIVMFIAVTADIFAQDENFNDVSSEEEKKLEWSGNFDIKYSLLHMDQQAAQYTLQFFQEQPTSSYLSQYKLEPYLNAEYHANDVGFVLKTHAAYYSDLNASIDLFESYGVFNPSFNLTMQAGKRVYSWGKGYAFNPVGFVNPVKDVENPELAQAGLLSANVEYIKSFSSDALQSLALTFVVIPISPLLNSRYGEAERTDFALKTYFLVWDTDIDLAAYVSSNTPDKYGIDFSRNIKENFEIHGELSFARNAPRYSILNDSLHTESIDGSVYLFGIRYLDNLNVTVIAEYYHNQFGMTGAEYLRYAGYLEKSAASQNPARVQHALAINQKNFRGSTLMQDYFYVKLTYPEPFELLYFTPSLYTIYNISDKSFLLSFQLNYKPVTNVEFIFWPTALTGGSLTEYGDKQIQEKIELWMRVFF